MCVCVCVCRLRLAEEEREQCEPLSPWCMLKSSARQFQRRISPSALSAMAELFLVNGDMSAWLYTGSQVRTGSHTHTHTHLALHAAQARNKRMHNVEILCVLDRAGVCVCVCV